MLERSSIIRRDANLGSSKSAKVTIVIGFACKDSIVLASDSQGTYANGFKATDVKKVFEVRFGNESALVGISGYIDPANAFVAKFRFFRFLNGKEG